MGKGSNSTTTNQSSTSTTSPDSNAYNAYLALLKRAQGVASTPYEGYSGEQVAPINQQQQAGFGGINTAADYLTAQQAPLSAADIQKYMDPYTQSVIDATQKDFDVQNQRALSATSGNAAAQGALGGDREAVARALTQESQSRTQAPIIAGLRSQGYNQAVQTAQNQQQQALRAGLAGIQGAQAQVGAGTLEQQTQQAQDTQNRLDYYQKQGYPFQVAQWLAAIDTGVGSQMGGTSTSVGTGTTQGPSPNPWSQLVGGGLALAGLFSDRDVKENIEKIGETNDGQPIYRFNYKGHPQTVIGLMHDEVEDAHPEATGRVAGIGVVDYRKATEDAVEKAEGGGVGDDYNTRLSPAQERAFLRWKAQNAPRDSGYDYDLRGAYRANMQRDPESGHMGDRFKKPNHPTFSDQSQYAVGDQLDRAGHWIGEEFVPPAIKARGGRIAGFAPGGAPSMPWSEGPSWIPQAGGITGGRGAPSAPQLNLSTKAPEQQSGLSKDAMKGIGAIGKGIGGLDWGGMSGAMEAGDPLSGDAWGGGSFASGDAWGGSGVNPLPGLSADDYGLDYGRGGRVRRYANGGYAFGGGPDDEDIPNFDERFSAAFPNRMTAGVGASRPAFEVVNPDEPFRMPSREAVDSWRSGVDRDIGTGVTEQPTGGEPAELPPEVISGRSKRPSGATADDAEGPSEAMGYSGRPRLVSGVAAPASTPEGAPDESFLGRLGIKMTPELKSGLLMAGLSMMANRHGGPGSFLSNLGEAGVSGVGAYNQTVQSAMDQAEKVRKEAFEREKFEAPFSRKTLAQQESERHNKAVERQGYKPQLVRRTNPETGEEEFFNYDPNASVGKQLTPLSAAGNSASPMSASSTAPAGTFDYRKDLPRLEKGDKVPEPHGAIAGHGIDALKSDAETYLTTGILPKASTAGKSPIAAQQLMYQKAVQNYGIALGLSRGLTPEQMADIRRFGRDAAKFPLSRQGDQTVALGTAIRHLDSLRQFALAWDEAKGNINAPILRQVAANFYRAKGEDAPTNLEQAARIAGPEIIKAIGVAGAGTGGERFAQEEGFSPKASTKQILGSIKVAQDFLAGQLPAKEAQARNVGFPHARFIDMVGASQYDYLQAIRGHGGGAETGKTSGFIPPSGAVARQDKSGKTWYFDPNTKQPYPGQ